MNSQLKNAIRVVDAQLDAICEEAGNTTYSCNQLQWNRAYLRMVSTSCTDAPSVRRAFRLMDEGYYDGRNDRALGVLGLDNRQYIILGMLEEAL